MRHEGVKAGAAGVARAALIIAMCMPLGAQSSQSAKKAASAGPASVTTTSPLASRAIKWRIAPFRGTNLASNSVPKIKRRCRGFEESVANPSHGGGTQIR